MTFCDACYPDGGEARLMNISDNGLVGMKEILETVYFDEEVYIKLIAEMAYRGLL